MSCRYLLLFFLLCFSSLSLAREYPFLKDPQKLLPKIDKFIGWTTFEDTFRCGSQFVYQMNQCAQRCEPYYCEEICKKPEISTVTIKKCDGQSVSFMAGGKVWLKFLKNRFKDYNFIRGWLGIPLRGKLGKRNEVIGKNYVTLKKLEKIQHKLKNGKNIEAIRLYVTYSFWNKLTKKFGHSYQSIVVGRGNQTGGLLLEHRFHEVSKPVSYLIKMTIPNDKVKLVGTQ